MATSVLGKRSRQVFKEEVVEITSPTKKRQTRRTAPQIYEDAARAAAPSSVTRTNRVSKRNVINDTAKDFNTIQAAPTADEESKENLPPTFSTPSASRFTDVFAAPTPFTPKHRVRLGVKLLTPRSNRSVGHPRLQSAYAAARQLFTQAANPCRLVGRDTERQQLHDFIENALGSKTGGCTYVSGPPGTGKSALVQELFQSFAELLHVKTSVVNCVTFRTSDQVLGKLRDDLDLPALKKDKFGQAGLAKSFTLKSKPVMHLVLMDEIDSLLDSDCEFLYNIFEWAMHPSSSLVLIGIANALDLTDRFLPRLKARDLKPQLLPFLPYTAQQMSDIIAQKLRTLLPAETTMPSDFVPFLHPAAIQLIGKKIASQTGDLRKAFNLARRTIDQVEQETTQRISADGIATPTKKPLSEISNLSQQLPPSPPKSSPLKPMSQDSSQTASVPQLTAESAPRATIGHVAKLAASIFNDGTVSRLRGLNLQQKVVLCSLIANERKRSERDPYKTPSKSSARVLTVKDLFEKYAKLCQKDEGLLQPLKGTEFRDVIASLETLGLVHESTRRTSSLLTPSKTPSRGGRNPDERQVASAVSESEMRENSNGAGGDLLQRLLDE